MQFNEDEKKCIRIIARWFRENKTLVNRDEAMRELGVYDDKYDVLMKLMEHNGVIENVTTTRGENGYAKAFQPSAHAEELVREFDKENETTEKDRALKNESELQIAFREFLKDTKGYPRETMLDTKKRVWPDLTIIELVSKKPIVLIKFKLSNQQIDIANAARQVRHYKEMPELSNCRAYIVYPSIDNSSEPFGICEVFDNSYESLLSTNKFPAYEDLQQKVKRQTEVSGDGGGDGVLGIIMSYAKKEAEDMKHDHIGSEHVLLGILIAEKGIGAEVLRNHGVSHGKVSGEVQKKPSGSHEVKNLRQTGPTKRIIKYANEAAQKWNHKSVKSQHMLLGILNENKRSARAVKILLDMGVNLEEVKRDIYEKIAALEGITGEQFINKYNIEIEHDPKKPPEEPNDISVEMEGIASVMGDRATTEDKLGREEIADALAGMFVHTKDVEGFTVALLGGWGEGKTTVMNLIKKRLNESHPGEFEFATFNAWEYEHTDNIAAGLAQEVVSGLIDGTKWLERLWLTIHFAFREHGWNFIRCVICLLITAIVPGLSWIVVKKWGGNLDTIFQMFIGVGAVGVLVPLTFYTYRGVKRAIEHPMAVRLKTYLNLPSYGKHLGLIPVLKRHIKTLCDLRVSGRGRKLVVFVDDLDRCQSECIARTLDAIRLVMEIENVIVLIGIDHRIAFRAIEEHFYREIDKNNENLKKENENHRFRTAADIARDYLSKIIHLPVKLAPAKDMTKYIDDKLFVDAVEPLYQEKARENDRMAPDSSSENKNDNKGNDQTEQTAITVETERDILEVLKETFEERDSFRKLAGLFQFSNPRQLLRLRNSYRLLKVLNKKDGYRWNELMDMLFWQEFMANLSFNDREKCMNSLWDENVSNQPECSTIREIIKAVRQRIKKLYDKEEPEKLAQFVRTVVLPHSEEGIDDTNKSNNRAG